MSNVTTQDLITCYKKDLADAKRRLTNSKKKGLKLFIEIDKRSVAHFEQLIASAQKEIQN